jgi:hypothetical protein
LNATSKPASHGLAVLVDKPNQEQNKMANTARKMNEIVTIHRTPEDVGYEYVITLRVMDKGMRTVNGMPSGDQISSARVALQAIETAEHMIERDRRQKAVGQKARDTLDQKEGRGARSARAKQAWQTSPKLKARRRPDATV